ncbi:MAG: class I SAM-dependent methyltransferase [Anaerolineae bacterium]
MLEFGCGTGKNTPFLASISDLVYAVDLTPEMILRAKARLDPAQVAFALADITCGWPFVSGCVDLVSCNLILEHVEDLAPVYSEARRVLRPGGRFFLSELHPYRQYQGKKATFALGDTQVEIPAYVHHVSDFVQAAEDAGLALESLREWWRPEDEGKPPRLLSCLFGKVGA